MEVKANHQNQEYFALSELFHIFYISLILVHHYHHLFDIQNLLQLIIYFLD